MSRTGTPFADRLDAARAAIRFAKQHREPLRSELGVGWLDQAQAAYTENLHNLDTLVPLLRELEPDRWQRAEIDHDAPTLEQEAALLAALMGCRVCPHLRGSAQPPAPAPVYVDLNRRLARCLRCCRTRLRPIDDDRCEICDQAVPDRQFSSFVVAYGALTIVGNHGACCDAIAPASAEVVHPPPATVNLDDLDRRCDSQWDRDDP